MNPGSPSGATVRRLRDRQRESTAQEILTAAEQVFVERGIFATHMADIAAKAGVAVGTLYNHYKDRDSLLSALIEQRRAEMLQRIDESMAKTGELLFGEQLRETWRVIFTFFDQHWQFWSIFMQAESGPPVMAQPSLCIQRDIYGRWQKLADRGRKQRALRPKMAALAPSLLMGLTRAMMIRRLFIPEDPSPLEHLDTLIEFFFHGALGKAP